MKQRILFLTLTLASTWAAAQDAATPPPPPPRWSHALHMKVIIGADVSASLDNPLTATPVLLQPLNLAEWTPLPSGAKECVVEAVSWANLASERVFLRPQLLRCFDGQNRELTPRPITGYAVDQDIRVGLKSTLAWSPAAKELLFMGVGVQSKQNFLSRWVGSTLNAASMGLSDDLLRSDDKSPGITPEAVREIRSTESLLPTLTLPAGREFDLVLQAPVSLR